jgi:hypothetical protein
MAIFTPYTPGLRVPNKYGMSIANLSSAILKSSIGGQAMTSKFITALALFSMLATASGCSEPLSRREQGGLIGGAVGAGSGAIIGSTVGHAAVGALIGGPVGLIAGALIGDQLMGQDRRQDEQQRQIDRNQEELQRLRRENERLRENQGER